MTARDWQTFFRLLRRALSLPDPWGAMSAAAVRHGADRDLARWLAEALKAVAEQMRGEGRT